MKIGKDIAIGDVITLPSIYLLVLENNTISEEIRVFAPLLGCRAYLKYKKISECHISPLVESDDCKDFKFGKRIVLNFDAIILRFRPNFECCDIAIEALNADCSIGINVLKQCNYKE